MTLPVAFKYNDCPGKDTVEREEKSELHVCNICGRNFLRKGSLTVHLNSHQFNGNLDGKFEREAENTCNLCFKKFSAKKNLLKHLRDVHKNFSEAERMVVKKIKCPERNCKFLCRMMKELRGHIEKSHEIKILKDTLQFSSETVFQKWKKEEESNTISWFVTGRKKTTLMDGTKKQTLYCHRTGHYSPKGFGKYRMRSVGSCKIGVTCPAAMEVIESPDGDVTVIYYKTHLGHMQDVVYLKLSTEERAHLAEKIKQGFSFDAILDDVKESRHFDKEKKKRIHLLSKKDLYSIMRTVNCSNRKTITKGVEEEGVNKTCLNSSENSAGMGNLPVGKISDISHQNLSFYPPHSSVQKEDFQGNLLSQKYQRDLHTPQTSREGPASQIVIVSPDSEYTSVAEIILLSANDALPPQPADLPRPIVSEVENCSVQKSGSQITSRPDDRNRTNASNLHLQLKEKLLKISELLPQSEHLTPKQFDLIHAKLNAVLDIFNAANERASARKLTAKKGGTTKNKIFRSKSKARDSIFGQRLSENQLVYTLYN